MRTRLIWLFIVVLFLAARYQNLPGVLTERGVELNDTDPYYRLARMEQVIQGGGTYPLHDPSLSYPVGFDVPWPMGLDYTLALPLKLLGVHKRLTFETLGAVAIPILSLPSLYFAAKMTSFVAGPVAAMAVGFLTASAPTDIYASALGRIDHHFLEGLLSAAALYFLLKKRSRWLAFLLAFAPSFWPQAWVMGLFCAAAYAIGTDQTDERKRAPSLFFCRFTS